MTEVDRQKRRIDHINVMTGKHPTVLDLSEDRFNDLVEEVLGMHWYPLPDRYDPDECRRILRNGFDIFGVRFIRGYV